MEPVPSPRSPTFPSEYPQGSYQLRFIESGWSTLNYVEVQRVIELLEELRYVRDSGGLLTDRERLVLEAADRAGPPPPEQLAMYELVMEENKRRDDLEEKVRRGEALTIDEVREADRLGLLTGLNVSQPGSPRSQPGSPRGPPSPRYSPPGSPPFEGLPLPRTSSPAHDDERRVTLQAKIRRGEALTIDEAREADLIYLAQIARKDRQSLTEKESQIMDAFNKLPSRIQFRILRGWSLTDNDVKQLERVGLWPNESPVPPGSPRFQPGSPISPIQTRDRRSNSLVLEEARAKRWEGKPLDAREAEALAAFGDRWRSPPGSPRGPPSPRYSPDGGLMSPRRSPVSPRLSPERVQGEMNRSPTQFPSPRMSPTRSPILGRQSPAEQEARPGVEEESPAVRFFATHQPVEVISGIKIYDAADLPGDIGLRYDQPLKKTHDLEFLYQPNDQLDHIFLSNARNVIDRIRRIEQRDPGMFPTIEMHLTVLAGIFDINYRYFRERLPREEAYNVFFGYNRGFPIVFRQHGLYIEEDFGIHYALARGRNLDEGPESPEIPDFIRNAYEQLGFEESYFGFVNPRNPYVMAKQGKIPLRPDTFEAFAFFDRNPEKYAESYMMRFGSQKQYSCHTDQDGKALFVKVGGWSKKALFEAIRQSGLMKDVTNIPGKKGRYAKMTTKGITYKDVGLKAPRFASSILGGLSDTRSGPYLAHCYYETIYRKIFSTLDFINWPLLCKLNAVSLEGIRAVAVEHYDANPEVVATAPISDICAFVTEQSRKRLELTEELARTLAKEAKTMRRGFTHRPGSRWVAPPTMHLMAGGQELPPAPTNDYAVYLRIKKYCEDDAVTKDNLIGFAEQLHVRDELPEDLGPFSKADICHRLLDILLPRAEKYEAVLFDCSDPAIKLRHILNSANTMGLGGIFPKDISRLTKERACEIITNYIALLQEAKGYQTAELMSERERERRYQEIALQSYNNRSK